MGLGFTRRPIRRQPDGRGGRLPDSVTRGPMNTREVAFMREKLLHFGISWLFRDKFIKGFAKLLPQRLAK